LFTAAGSANETRAALKLACSWGYLGSGEAEIALAIVGRVAAMLRGLTR
jgi:hypothetical protein